MNKIILAIIILSIAATLFMFPRLPEKVPIHWNVKGEIDNYGSRYFTVIFSVIPLLLFWLKKIIPEIDPKAENYKKHAKAFNATIYTTIIFLIFMHWLTVKAAFDNTVDISFFVLAGIGVLFTVTGNFLTQARPNYTFGIRTPWTLANEIVWKKTHRVGGFLFFITGIITLVLSFWNNEIRIYIFISLIFFTVLFSFLYSYLLFRKLKKQK